MGGLLRRLSALLHHRPMSDPLRPLWDFDDLDATEARFRALRAEALTQLARVQGLREDYDGGDRLLDEVDRGRSARPRSRRPRARPAAPLVGRQGGGAAALRARVRGCSGRGGGLARRRRRAHGRARGARPRRLRRLDEPRARAGGAVAGRRVLGGAAPQQPRLGALRRRGVRAGARRPSSARSPIRERDPDNPAAIELAREAVAEARKALGRDRRGALRTGPGRRTARSRRGTARRR